MQVTTSQHLRLVARAVQRALKLSNTYDANTSHAAHHNNLCTWLTRLYVNSANEPFYWVTWRGIVAGRDLRNTSNDDIESMTPSLAMLNAVNRNQGNSMKPPQQQQQAHSHIRARLLYDNTGQYAKQHYSSYYYTG